MLFALSSVGGLGYSQAAAAYFFPSPPPPLEKIKYFLVYTDNLQVLLLHERNIFAGHPSAIVFLNDIIN